MVKRILLALTLAASLGGAVVACNTPAGTANPTIAVPSTEASTPASSDLLPSTEPSMEPSTEPSAS